MKEGVVDSGVERHSVWTPGWNSPSCSSLGMTGNMKAMLNRMPRSYFCRFSRVLRQRMSNQLIRSPVFVVWSLGGMVPWLAFCLCHFSCWPLVPFQWHWSHSNVQGPERAAVMQSCNVESTRSAQELHPLRSRHRYTLTTKLTWRQDSQHAVPQSMKKNLSQNALPPPQAWIARRLVLKQDAVWLCMNTAEELASLQCMSIHPSIHPSVRLLAHHSPLRPPPEDSQQHNHTVPLPEHTHFLLSANRKTHYPATKQMGNNRWSFYFKSWTFFFLPHALLIYLTRMARACCGCGCVRSCCGAGCGWGVWQVAVFRVKHALPWERDVIHSNKPSASMTALIPEDNLGKNNKSLMLSHILFSWLSATFVCKEAPYKLCPWIQIWEVIKMTWTAVVAAVDAS